MFRRPLNMFLTLTIILTVALGLVYTPAPVSARSALGVGPDLKKAMAWLATLQNKDGGFTDGFKPESSIGATADAVLAIGVMHVGLSTFTHEDATPLTFLAEAVKDGKVTTLGLLGKTALAAVAVGADTHNFGSKDLAKELGDGLVKVTDASDLFGLTIGIIGLTNAGGTAPKAVIDILLKSRNKDGGWGYADKQASDTNTTALAIQALIAAGKKDEITPSLAYLEATENDDGGWPFQKPSDNGTDTDSNSTAAVIQALLAAKEDLNSWGKTNPLVVLSTFQMPSGAFTYQLKQPAESFLSTVAVIPALNQINLATLAATMNPDKAATPSK